MGASSEEVRKKTRDLQEFERGTALFREGKVRYLASEGFWRGEEQLKMSVEEDGEAFRVSLFWKDGSLGSASCSCRVHGEEKGLCRHEAAAALYAMERKGNFHVSTSEQVRRMLRGYADQELWEAMSSGQEGKLLLKPSFREEASGLFISFQTGREKLHPVKDLAVFDRREGQRRDTEGFSSRGGQWEEGSLPLAREMERTVEEYLHGRRASDLPVAPELPALREIRLVPAAFDRWMELLEGRTIEFLLSGRPPGQYRIQKGLPGLSGILRPCGRDGFRAELSGRFRALYGRRSLYLAGDGVLYCCGEEASEALRGFFEASEEEEDGSGLFLEIGARDFPAFCSHVLPRLAPYLELAPMGVEPEAYHMEPLEAEFYFDSPGAGEVTLEVLFRYGAECYTPFGSSELGRSRRDAAAEYRAGLLIRKYFYSRYADENLFVIRDDDEAMYRLLSGGLEEFGAFGRVVLSPAMEERKILPAPRVSFQASLEKGWLELSADAEGLTESQIRGILSAYRMKREYYRVRPGQFLRLEDPGLSALAELSGGFLTEELGRLPRYRSLYAAQVLRESGQEFSGDEAFWKLIRSMEEISWKDYPVPASLEPVLREYQKKGFRWMRALDAYGFGGLLADEMGLGKTVQAIALLADEAGKDPSMEALIVCPASLIYNWESELRRFAPELSVRAAAGTAAERRALLSETAAGPQVYITSYDLLRRDLSLYREKHFRFQILDEAQYIKNRNTQNARAAKKIRADSRFALTGTPAQNRLEELWSIFDFLMPGFLFGYGKFKKEFEQPIERDGDQAAVRRLRRLIAPFLLRRYKKDVLEELPDKLEQVVYSRMEKEQRKLYSARAHLLKASLEGMGSEQYKKERIQVLSELLRLRQLCCDPSLCYEDYRGGSAKLETCMELLRRGILDGHKILVFSQFTSMLEIIGRRLKEEGTAYYELTGKTGKEERLELVNAFHEDSVPVFLISLKAGGTGLNLTAADLVIHYDPWWNLAAEEQASDRAHRIGQKNQVTVFRLIARDTIEEGILRLQQKKRRLEEQVTGGSFSEASLDREELLRLLEEEHGIY